MGDRGFEKADSRNLSHVISERVRKLFRNNSRFNAEEVRAFKIDKWVYFNS